AGASPSPTIVGLDPLEGRVHFLVGNEPAKWRTGVSTYRAIRYHELYDGIDLLYQGTPEGIKSTFIVAPGASPQDVTFDYSGIEGLTIGEDGSLYVHTAAGALVESAPVCYQEIDGNIVPVDSS